MSEARTPHVASKKYMEVDGKPYEASIFSGDGKLYDELRGDNPLIPRRVGTFLLRPLCPIYESIKEGRVNAAIIPQPVEIRTPLPVEIEIVAPEPVLA